MFIVSLNVESIVAVWNLGGWKTACLLDVSMPGRRKQDKLRRHSCLVLRPKNWINISCHLICSWMVLPSAPNIHVIRFRCLLLIFKRRLLLRYLDFWDAKNLFFTWELCWNLWKQLFTSVTNPSRLSILQHPDMFSSLHFWWGWFFPQHHPCVIHGSLGFPTLLAAHPMDPRTGHWWMEPRQRAAHWSCQDNYTSGRDDMEVCNGPQYVHYLNIIYICTYVSVCFSSGIVWCISIFTCATM